MRYRVKAVGADSSVIETEFDAGSEAELRAMVAARGMSVLSLKKVAVRRRYSRFPLMLFNQELLSLLKSGIPLAEAVSALAEKEGRATVRTVLTDIHSALREGRTFSSALEATPHAFPDLYVAMIRAAERTSDLGQALTRYIQYQQQVDLLRDKLISAAIYPVLLLGVGGLVVLFLLGYVVPRFSHIYEDLGNNLPWLSRVLLQWGLFVESHTLLLAAVVLIAAGSLFFAVRNPATWTAIGRELWRLPALGKRLKGFQLARFYRTLGMLLSGGIPVVPAMGMVSGLLSPMLRGGLMQAIEGVREGRSFSATLTECGLSTPVARHMINVGERAGDLGEVLIRAAEFHEEQIGREVEWLTRLFGPVLMLLIGCSIGLIVVLMYLPIFQLAESIG